MEEQNVKLNKRGGFIFTFIISFVTIIFIMFNPKPITVLFLNSVTPISLRIALVAVAIVVLIATFIFGGIVFIENKDCDIPGILSLIMIALLLIGTPFYFGAGNYFSNQAQREAISESFENTEIVQVYNYDNWKNKESFFVKTLDGSFYLTLTYLNGRYEVNSLVDVGDSEELTQVYESKKE